MTDEVRAMCLWFHPGIHRVRGVRRCGRSSCVGYHPRHGKECAADIVPTARCQCVIPPAVTGGDRMTTCGHETTTQPGNHHWTCIRHHGHPQGEHHYAKAAKK